MSRYSFLVPMMPLRAEHLPVLGGLVQYGPFERLWQGQSLMIDSYHAVQYLAGSGIKVPTGFAVSLMPMRHPFDAAVELQSMAVTTGHSVVAGFGPGAKVFQEHILGAAYASQLDAVREYVTVVRNLLENGSVQLDGAYFSCKLDLQTMPRPPIEIGLGVLRPAMARLAGEVADVAITWLTPASYVADVLIPALEKGAAVEGRPRPRVVAVVPVAVVGDEEDGTDLVLTGNGGHLRMPHYQNMLARAGIRVDMEDLKGTARRVIEGGAFLAGTMPEVVSGLQAFFAAGVDEVVLNVAGLFFTKGPDTGIEQVRRIREAAQ